MPASSGQAQPRYSSILRSSPGRQAAASLTRKHDEERSPIRNSRAECIRRILAGEKHLFHELIRPCERAIYFLLLSILRNEAEAEDAAQETVLKIYRNLHLFRGERSSAPGRFRLRATRAWAGCARPKPAARTRSTPSARASPATLRRRS